MSIPLSHRHAVGSTHKFRVLVTLALLLSASVTILASCSGDSNATTGAGRYGDLLDAHLAFTPAENRALREAPMLRALVERGELPPLDQRLPQNPLVITPTDQPGLYGGTWRKFDTLADFASMKLANAYYPLVRWLPDSSGVGPGIAESWGISEDARVVTFNLRRGLRWSDGAPMTSSDLMYWWELCLDGNHPMTPPAWAYTNGVRMEVSAPDEHTLVFTYAEPYTFAALQVATGFWWCESMFLPRHYLEPFHPDFSNDDDYEDFEVFERKRDTVTNPERPNLGPWQLSYLSKTSDRAVYERNPYYWVVDQDGRQLPYIDRVEVVRVQSAEAGVLYAIQGSVDAQYRQLEFRDYPLLKRFADRAGYEIQTWEEGTASWHACFLNWSCVDRDTGEPDWDRRELFRHPDFRRGLAAAINREQINQAIWGGTGRVQAAAISDESWHFNSERGQEVLQRWITQWSEYDPDHANALLDAAGMQQRDREGFRMWKGEPFTLMLEYFDVAYSAEQAVLFEQDWEAVGIRVIARQANSNDLVTRRTQGMFDCYLQHNSELDLFTFPDYAFPTNSNIWHPIVGRWYESGGQEGEAPEGFMAELLDLYDQCKLEPDLNKRHELVLDAIEIQLEHGPFMIGSVGRQKSLVLVSRDLINIPAPAILGPWATCQPGASFPEQMAFTAERLYGEADNARGTDEDSRQAAVLSTEEDAR